MNKTQLLNRVRRFFGMKPVKYPCCRKPKNLGTPVPDRNDPSLTVRRCQVCQRRHFELEVKPGKLGITLASG